MIYNLVTIKKELSEVLLEISNDIYLFVYVCMYVCNQMAFSECPMVTYSSFT